MPLERASLITGSLWLDGYDDDYRSDLATRYECILLWLRKMRPGYRGPWLSISTDGTGWPDNEADRLIHGAGVLEATWRTEGLAERLERLISSRLVDAWSALKSEPIEPAAYLIATDASFAALSEAAGVSVEDIQANPTDPELQKFLRDLVAILGAVVDLNGGDEARAIEWYRSTTLRELGSAYTAEQLVPRDRAQAVLRYIENLAAGATG